MNLSELLNMGIIASVGGDGGLQLDAPKGALTPDLIERIRHHKPSLIAEIQAAREVGELGELHFLCRNPAGEELPPAGDVHRETPTDTAPPIRATCWLIHFTDREPLEVWFAPAADHAEVLAAYRDAVAAEPVPERGITKPTTSTMTTSCKTCRHLKRPGLSDGHCGGRDDLPPAYTAGHPLRRLPDDRGAGCTTWEESR